MKILYLSIIVILSSVLLISFLSHANADTIPGPYVPPTKDLTEAQKQSLLQEAISLPEIKTWSDKWQFSSVDYAGTNTPTPHWQTMTLRLYLPPNAPAPKSCSSGWVAFVVFDYVTGKILDSVYPNSTSTCIDSNHIVTFQDPQMNVLSGESPLKQFRSGIKAEDVKCKEGFQLVIKSEDGSPMCVKPDDGYILIYRGWAKELIQSVTWTNQSTCEGTKVLSGDYRKNIFPVLIMSQNSTATVCVTYNFVSDWKSYPNKDVYPHGILETCCFVHPRWYSSPVSSNKFEILANPPLFNVTSVNNGSKISVTYKIYAKSDSKGFYDTSVPFGACLSYPLAVGYGPSEVDATKFHADFDIPCFASIENVDSVNIVSGMTYKEVQFP